MRIYNVCEKVAQFLLGSWIVPTGALRATSALVALQQLLRGLNLQECNLNQENNRLHSYIGSNIMHLYHIYFVRQVAIIADFTPTSRRADNLPLDWTLEQIRKYFTIKSGLVQYYSEEESVKIKIIVINIKRKSGK